MSGHGKTERFFRNDSDNAIVPLSLMLSLFIVPLSLTLSLTLSLSFYNALQGVYFGRVAISVSPLQNKPF